MRALRLVVPWTPKYSSSAGMEGIYHEVLDKAIDSEGNFRGPDFLDHPPECSVGRSPGREFILKSEQDAMTLLAAAPSKEQWKDFSNNVFLEINTIAEVALLWSANPRAEQKPWTSKHNGRGQIPVFKQRALHGAKTCDEWTRDPLRTVKLTAKELEAIQVRPHDRDKTRYLVESPISSHSIGEDEGAWKPMPLWGKFWQKETKLCSSTTCLQVT